MNRSRRPIAERQSPDPRSYDLGHQTVSALVSSIEGHRTLALLGLATLVLKSLIFAPISLWPLTFVCLVPWLILVGASTHAPRVYFYSYVWALAFFLIDMHWLYEATGAGYVALSIYLAAYFPLMACPLRHVIRRRRIPLAIAFPCVWVGGELLRAVVISGFPWFFLSHSLYKVLTLIQVSDLVGAYGVSFVAAAVNGAIADCIFLRRRSPADSESDPSGGRLRRRARMGAGFAGFVVVAACVYGQVQLHRDTEGVGPKVAVIQGDYVMTVDADEADDVEKRNTYFAMMQAAAREKPDLYLLPETPWIMYLNPEARDFKYPPLSRSSFQALQKHAAENNAYVVTGSASLVLTPYDLLSKERRHNSATVFHPDGREPGRYDKVHLVYFGEVVPFQFGKLRFLYFWMNRLMPFSGPDGDYEYSLFRGEGFHSFEMRPASQPGRTFRFGIPICYEDVMPYVAREFAHGGDAKRVDFLLNISNDGWFGRSIQQPQHLAICVFRAVENRVGAARSVNTGVSAFVDPSGRIHDGVVGKTDDPWPRNAGFSVANVGVDSRYTLYTRFGDWFGWGCALLWLLLFLDYWIMRARMLIED